MIALLALWLAAGAAKPIVQSVSVGADEQPAVLGEVRSGIPPPARVELRRGEGGPTLIAIGPVLGSMDSRDVATDVATDVAYSGGRLTLTATITRSADYQGGVHKNVLWRPRISVLLAPQRARLTFRVVWRMRLTTGTEVAHTRMPPYPPQTYPLVVTKTVARAR